MAPGRLDNSSLAAALIQEEGAAPFPCSAPVQGLAHAESWDAESRYGFHHSLVYACKSTHCT